MAVIDIQIVADLISEAKASYGDLNKSLSTLKDLLTDGQTGANFTETQADACIERYDFIHQLPNTSSGFSSIVFWDKIDQKYVLAIRETDFNLPGVPTDILSTDFLGIRGRGIAIDQAIVFLAEKAWQKVA